MDYTCPYCNKPTTLVSPNYTSGYHSIGIEEDQLEYAHRIGLRYAAITCPNSNCKKLNFTVRLTEFYDSYPYKPSDNDLYVWPLLPESAAKPQPDFIPAPILEDYVEACRIKNLSPKAAATLARRCMQGMIRDFHGIKRKRLYDEIDAIKDLIPDQQWKAIDALRKVGNIGAHMETDVNIIIEIDEGEVAKLIAFIEYLFEQWYVKQDDDNKKLAAVEALAGIKTNKQSQPVEQATKSAGEDSPQ